MAVSAFFRWNGAVRAIADATLKRRRAALFMASEARRLMDPYTPMRTGALKDTADVYAESSGAVVHYKVPYAARHYYGAGGTLRRVRHPLASAFWDKAMLAARRRDLLSAVENFIKGGR